MSLDQQGDKARPIILHHALTPGEADQADRLFQRNASLLRLFPDDRRAFYAALAAQASFAEGVAAEPVRDGSVRGWWLRPADADPEAAVFFVHGGGYHLGDARSYLGFASQLASRTGRAVFSVDYALAPEHRFPAAFDDIMQARAWFLSRGVGSYAGVGDSAGGGLVMAMAQHAAPDDRLTALVLFSPWTDLSISGASARDPAARDPVFQSGFLEGLARSYLGGADPRDPRASPLFGDLDALPPIQIQVGTEERLLDDSVRLAEQAARPGAIVRLDVFEGLYHVFQRDVGALKTAGMALDMAARFIVEHSSSAD